LPDIDLDVSAEIRQGVIDYLKRRWGENNVVQISTFGTLQPKAAIKEVFRARGIEFEKANILTKVFPDTEIKHDDDASYTIEDALRISDEFRDAMEPYKAEVELAKRIEGCIKSRGVHAAGVLISSEDVNTYLPLSYDAKSENYMCSFEMGDAEKFCVKVDILGLKLLTLFDLCSEKINEIEKNGWPQKKEDIVVETIEDVAIIEKDEKEIKMDEKTLEEIMLDYFSEEYMINAFPIEDGFVYYLTPKKTEKEEFIFGIIDNSKEIFVEEKGKYLNAILSSYGFWPVNTVIIAAYQKEVVYSVSVDKIKSNDKSGAIKVGKIVNGELVRND